MVVGQQLYVKNVGIKGKTMKLPDNIRMFGFEWKVIQKPKSRNGCGSYSKKTITIGTECTQEVLDTFLHEICELILVHLGLSFDNNIESEPYFFLTHKDYQMFINHLSTVLLDNKLIGVYENVERFSEN